MSSLPQADPSASAAEPVAPDRDRLAWLALALTPGLGPRRILGAVERAGTAETVLGLEAGGLEALGLAAPAVSFLAGGHARQAALAELEALGRQGGRLLTFACAAYPERLRQIFDPPPVLWLRGSAELLSRPMLAVVGTRHPTPYGSGMAEMLARDLSHRGLLIASGMARGIDTCAHRGALAAQAPTLAVWGTGIDVVYPRENRRLAEEILALGGAILSEVRLGTFPAPQNFPRRNRILSGMSVGVLVVEAAENSGTRVTARCAMEQNRDVYAVPGNATSRNSWGPNTLIKQGAKLTATWEDVWEDLPSQVRLELEQEAGSASAEAPRASLFREQTLAPHETLVLKVLRPDEATQLDELMARLEDSISSAEVFTALFELELAGRIRSLPGKNYVRAF